jgi:hypothetical protein
VRIVPSKLPGSITGDKGGEGGAEAGFSSSGTGGAVSPSPVERRFRDRSRFLLKSRCSKRGVKGSKRYGRERVTILAKDL